MLIFELFIEIDLNYHLNIFLFHDETTKKIKGAIVEISDAELFKRCGGLTGHKGKSSQNSMVMFVMFI